MKREIFTKASKQGYCYISAQTDLCLQAVMLYESLHLCQKNGFHWIYQKISNHSFTRACPKIVHKMCIIWHNWYSEREIQLRSRNNATVDFQIVKKRPWSGHFIILQFFKTLKTYTHSFILVYVPWNPIHSYLYLINLINCSFVAAPVVWAT